MRDLLRVQADGVLREGSGFHHGLVLGQEFLVVAGQLLGHVAVLAHGGNEFEDLLRRHADDDKGRALSDDRQKALCRGCRERGTGARRGRCRRHGEQRAIQQPQRASSLDHRQTGDDRCQRLQCPCEGDGSIGDRRDDVDGARHHVGQLLREGIEVAVLGRLFDARQQVFDLQRDSVHHAGRRDALLELGQPVRDAVELRAQRIRRSFEAAADAALEFGGELRKEVGGDHLTLLQHAVEFLRRDADGAGRDLESTRDALAQLAAQFFGLHIPLAHHLLDGQQRAFGLFGAQPHHRGGGRHGAEDVARGLTFQRGAARGSRQLGVTARRGFEFEAQFFDQGAHPRKFLASARHVAAEGEVELHLQRFGGQALFDH